MSLAHEWLGEASTMQEPILQQQILTELGELNRQVTKIQQNQQLMSVALLGGVDGDTKHGRLPVVEAKVDDHSSRIESLERRLIRWKAYAVAAGAIGGATGAIAGWAIQFLETIVKH